MTNYRTNERTYVLLTAEQEFVLGRYVQEGIKASEIIESGDFKRVDLRGLRSKVRAGDDARNQFIEHNIRLAMNTAAKFAKAHPTMDYEDLIQEANLGLIRAVEKFDPDKGFKFSTYATWWIRQACQRAVVNQRRSIRLPMHVETQVRKIQNVIDAYSAEHGVPPSVAHIADQMGLDDSEVSNYLSYLETTQVTSLDSPTSESSSLLKEEVLSEPESELVEDAAIKDSYSQSIRDALSFLDEIEIKVLFSRYGVSSEGGASRSLQQIGNDLGMAKERVRQIEMKAVSKLRHPASAIIDIFSDR